MGAILEQNIVKWNLLRQIASGLDNRRAASKLHSTAVLP
jgi:hypothetical protein